MLRDKPNVLQEKVAWLQRHDQECGGLDGMLPICVGLPVRAADHLDRARGILKGCKGTIVGWSTAPTGEIWNKLPTVIYVQFETAQTWCIEGMPDANVYPVPPTRKPWFLDRHRKTPQLQVTRVQFPLAPGFAITAHIAQGQTLHEGVIADFNISDSGNPFTTYVAATRVTGRDKLLILRPFPAKPFQNRYRTQPSLASLARRPGQLGRLVGEICGRKGMRRVQGAERQDCLYSRTMEALRRRARLSRMYSAASRGWGSISMQCLQVLVR